MVTCSYGTSTGDGRRFGSHLNSSFSDDDWYPLDDGSLAVNLSSVFPEGVPFYGTYFSAYLNVNGNISFSAASSTYTPDAIPGLSQPTIAPYFGDVDLRGGSGAVYRCDETGGATPRIIFTWWKVGYYNQTHTKLNSFQLILTNTDSVCDGSFEVEFRYEQLQWTTGSASGGSNGLGGEEASAGFDNGTNSGDPNDAVALPGSHTSSVLNLTSGSNVDEAGVFRYMVAGGRLPACGNSYTDVCEDCDDGDTDNNDDCTNLCQSNVCGDGFRNTSGTRREQCDDGGTTSGDGCSSTCVTEYCGDGTTNNNPNPASPNERCDDANSNNNDACLVGCVQASCGDGYLWNGTETCDRGILNTGDPDYRVLCASDCRSFCGDGTRNAGEGCDDGDNTSGDGCTNRCVAEYCGDGITNNNPNPGSPNEYCDDADEDNADACRNDCQVAVCGDSVRRTDITDPSADGFEGCDDGNDHDNNDECLDGCRTPTCGDGFLRTGVEDCDPAIVNTDDPDYRLGCSVDCSYYCGDGNRDPGEGCDDGNDDDTDDCSSECIPLLCGDGIRTGDEECDLGSPPLDPDGDNDNNGACLLSCRSARCGDAFVQTGVEACDPAIADREHPDFRIGCDATACDYFCGDGNSDFGEECDDSGNISGDGCTADCEDEFCGDGVTNDSTEQCDDGRDGDNSDECLESCRFSTCGDGFVRADIFDPDADGFEVCDPAIVDGDNPDHRTLCADDCSYFCGDGNRDDGEECDDGNNESGDGCDSQCVTEFCGDSVTNNTVEECDDGQDGDDFDECFDSCVAAACGDSVIRTDLVRGEAGFEACDVSIVDPLDPNFRLFCSDDCTYFCGDSRSDETEECDDGNYDGGDGCSATCTLEVCGDGLQEGVEECDDANDVDDDGCTGCVVDPGFICTDGMGVDDPSVCVDTCGNGILDPGEQCDDENIDDGDGCSSHCEEEPGWNCAVEKGEPCHPICGDSLVVGAEECDDANEVDDDGCTACLADPGTVCGEIRVDLSRSCEQSCGDGELDDLEECDDENVASLDGCDEHCDIEPGWVCFNEELPTVCSSDCGDGDLDQYEECDDGNETFGDGCYQCHLEAGWQCDDAYCGPICGDGLVRGTEECDDGNDEAEDGCETCLIDDGWYCNGSGTNASVCDQIPVCGDGVRQSAEECEDRNDRSGDGCSEDCELETGWECEESIVSQIIILCSPVCGDALVRGSEECDDENTTSRDGCSGCLVEANWVCDSGEPSLCSPSEYCGDGVLHEGEDCDDANSDDGDGCSSECDVDDGWVCDDAEPTTCAEDQDGDGVEDSSDVCPTVGDPDQEDLDGDGRGDACDQDIDGDGLENETETEIGSDPRLADSDGDGLTDLDEYNGETDPLDPDTDGDGLTDGNDQNPTVYSSRLTSPEGCGCRSVGSGPSHYLLLLILGLSALRRSRATRKSAGE